MGARTTRRCVAPSAGCLESAHHFAVQTVPDDTPSIITKNFAFGNYFERHPAEPNDAKTSHFSRFRVQFSKVCRKLTSN
jgi:hypothetical protein